MRGQVRSALLIRVAVIGGKAYREDRHQEKIAVAILRGEDVCWHEFWNQPLWRKAALRAHNKCSMRPIEERNQRHWFYNRAKPDLVIRR